MHGSEGTGLGIIFKHREAGNPEEFPAGRVDRISGSTEVEPQLAENRLGLQRLVGYN